MQQEPQFLSFKGLKQYSPDSGWADVDALLRSTPGAIRPKTKPQPEQATLANLPPPMPADALPPRDVPTLTDTPDTDQRRPTVGFDPLIQELFEQLQSPPGDELTQTWRTISAEVNLLTQRMAMRRELQERLARLDHEMADLRQDILAHLRQVQHAADQHVSAARLRAEVSALAKSKLATKLNGGL